MEKQDVKYELIGGLPEISLWDRIFNINYVIVRRINRIREQMTKEFIENLMPNDTTTCKILDKYYNDDSKTPAVKREYSTKYFVARYTYSKENKRGDIYYTYYWSCCESNWKNHNPLKEHAKELQYLKLQINP